MHMQVLVDRIAANTSQSSGLDGAWFVKVSKHAMDFPAYPIRPSIIHNVISIQHLEVKSS